MEKKESDPEVDIYRNLLQDRLKWLELRNKLQEKPSSVCVDLLEELDDKFTEHFGDPLGHKHEQVLVGELQEEQQQKSQDQDQEKKKKKGGRRLSSVTKLVLTTFSFLVLCFSIPAIVYMWTTKANWSCQIYELYQTEFLQPSTPSPTLLTPKKRTLKPRDPTRSKDSRETRQFLPPTSYSRVSAQTCASPRDHSDKTGACASSPCVHQDAICKIVQVDNSYECLCPSPYTGHRCESHMNDCLSNPCQNGGYCIDGIAEYFCECDPNYEGVNCETKKPGPCVLDPPCQNNATCIDIDFQTYRCECPLGFVGQICQVNFDECESSPCVNGGTCVDGPNSFSCQCRPGYDVMEYCQMEIDECASNPCSPNAYCENGVGEYICHCRPGYTGQLCDVMVHPCDSSPCYYNSTCVERLDGYHCECQPGFGFFHCDHDLNECEADTGHHLCEGGSCEDQGDGHHCHCGHGYRNNADNTACLPAYKCADNPCKNNAVCTGDAFEFNCSCTPNFHGPICDWDPDACFATWEPCGPGGYCSDTPTGFTCSCINGFQGDRCPAIDYCASSPCQNGGTCVDLVHGYRCECEPGYNPLNCEDIDYCAQQPCQNGGTCTNTGGGYTCTCTPNWSGSTCLVNLEQ